MQFFSSLEPNLAPSGSILTIGNFDGVHLGHQAILKKVIEKAKAEGVPSALLTFDPHPIQVLFPERKLRRLFSVQDLREQVEKLGLDILIVQNFDRDFAALTATQFLETKVLPALNPQELVVGHDFNFGANRTGTLDFLKDWCAKTNLSLQVQSPVEVDGERVSSRRIRELITAGEIARANLFLNRPFYLEGIVEKGAGRGRTIGIPTINIQPREFVQPRVGVYVSETLVAGLKFRSVSNLGVSPTFGPDLEIKLETHIFDFDENVYGQRVRVELLKYLRDEKKFASVDELKKQIAIDMQAARDFKGSMP